MTFDELAAKRDPLYAATKPVGKFADALEIDAYMEQLNRKGASLVAESYTWDRYACLGVLAIRALVNQGQPYYHPKAHPECSDDRLGSH